MDEMEFETPKKDRRWIVVLAVIVVLCVLCSAATWLVWPSVEDFMAQANATEPSSISKVEVEVVGTVGPSIEEELVEEASEAPPEPVIEDLQVCEDAYLPCWTADQTEVPPGTEVVITLHIPQGVRCKLGLGESAANGEERSVWPYYSDYYGIAECETPDGVDISPLGVYITVEAEIAEYEVPGNVVLLPGMNGVFYTIMTKPPFEVPYAYGQQVIIAAGNMAIDGDNVFITAKEGSLGNVFSNVCQEQGGCKHMVTGYKPGHVGVTIIDGGTEIPTESVAWALNQMLDGAGNCGNYCPFVSYGTVDPADRMEFTEEVSPESISLKMVEPPYPVYVPKMEGVPEGAEALSNNMGYYIGHVFHLPTGVSYSTMPEAGGVVVLCGSVIEINGSTCEADSIMTFVGKSDGTTPKDLNDTLKFEVGDTIDNILVHVYYAEFETELEGLKQLYDSWTWVE